MKQKDEQNTMIFADEYNTNQNKVFTEKYSIIIAHPNKQHSYKTAFALKQMGWLSKYITTVYYKKGTITYYLSKILPKKFSLRFNQFCFSGLEDDDVFTLCEFRVLWHKILSFLPVFRNHSEKYRIKEVASFNRKLLHIIEKMKPDALITYDTLSGDVLEALSRNGSKVIRIVDMSAPCYLEMENIMTTYAENMRFSDIEMSNFFLKRIREDRVCQTKKELQHSNAFLVASDFTANSLIKYGIDPSRIFKCVYGLEQKTSINQRACLNKLKKLNGLYIGNINVMKGVQFITRALDKCDECIEHFEFVGAIQDPGLTLSLNDKLIFRGQVSHEKIKEFCESADFAVFASLADGFGFAATECLAMGLPVICSQNAGAADLISDGYNGFCFEAGNASAIANKIRWLHDHPKELAEMKENAKMSIKKYTWEAYNSQIVNAITVLMNEKKENTKLS